MTQSLEQVWTSCNNASEVLVLVAVAILTQKAKLADPAREPAPDHLVRQGKVRSG